MYDIVVIGAGVTGCAIARELARYSLRTAVAEAACDVAMGASRANSAIVHAGYDCKPGTLMAKLNVEGNRLFDKMCAELSVPLGRCGSYVLAFENEDLPHLEQLLEFGQINGVPRLSIVSGDAVREKEPIISKEVKAALFAETGGITCPYELTMALAENAVANGVDFMLNWPVASISDDGDAFTITSESGQSVRARYIVNAAGAHADKISQMVGDTSFTIKPRKGEYMLLDRSCGADVFSVFFQPPSAMGKGVLVSPTVDGNVFAGPTAVDLTDPDDTSTTAEGLDELRRMSLRTAPNLPLNKVITSFSGVRAVADTGDFVIRPSEIAPRFVHAAGICSPGLSCAPAMGAYVVTQLEKAGLEFRVKPDFEPNRPHKKPFRNMSAAEREAAIAEDPLYRRIICRCETVTEAEIVSAIRRSPGATTLDGVKRRVRAGMGRCQGGFCAPRVMEILSKELGVPMTELTKFGAGSKLLVGRVKEERQ